MSSLCDGCPAPRCKMGLQDPAGYGIVLYVKHKRKGQPRSLPILCHSPLTFFAPRVILSISETIYGMSSVAYAQDLVAHCCVFVARSTRLVSLPG